MNAANSLPNDLDQIISGYFQAQMPRNWPAAPFPVELAQPQPRSQRGRYTLTAAAAILLGLVLMVSYGPLQPLTSPKSDLLQDSTASGDKFKAILDGTKSTTPNP